MLGNGHIHSAKAAATQTREFGFGLGQTRVPQVGADAGEGIGIAWVGGRDSFNCIENSKMSISYFLEDIDPRFKSSMNLLNRSS